MKLIHVFVFRFWNDSSWSVFVGFDDVCKSAIYAQLPPLVALSLKLSPCADLPRGFRRRCRMLEKFGLAQPLPGSDVIPPDR